jgi:hypothetical protein
MLAKKMFYEYLANSATHRPNVEGLFDLDSGGGP